MIVLTPSFMSMLGGTGVTVTGDGLVVSQGDIIACLFDGIEVRGVYICAQQVLCVSPLLERTGILQFMLNISGSNSGESVFTSCESNIAYLQLPTKVVCTCSTIFKVLWCLLGQ